MPARTLYSVLVGINDYQDPVPALNGCVNDVEAWQEYLNAQSFITVERPKALLNAEGTKTAIVSALIDSLQKTKKGDVVFFFFSGHGTREAASAVFGEIEEDLALESFVCYDSVRRNNHAIEFNLLSDKELHYLISVYGKEDIHIVTVFDCCHAGGITRNMQFESELVNERRYIPSSRLGSIAPMRNWGGFLFADDVSQDKVISEGWLKLFPQRRHITLSACQNDQSAYEHNRRGVFTTNLINVLKRSGGSITYYELLSRVRLSTQNQFRQTPEIYSIQGFEEDVLRTFLDCGQAERKFSCICYLKKDIGWVIDIGAIHGVSVYSGPVMIEVEAEMKFETPILRVADTYTQIHVGLAHLDENQQYNATLRSYLSGNTTFFIEHPDDEHMKDIVEQASGYLNKQKAPFVLTEDISQASYTVRSNQGVIQLCHNDELCRPATEILQSETEVSGKTLRAMHHIGQWEYIRALSNPDFNEVHYPIQFDISFLNANGSKMPVSLSRDIVEFRYEKDGKGNDLRRMKLSLRNTSGQKFFCSILYLSNTFQVYGNMLDNKVVGLAPGQVAWALNGKEIELDLEPHVIKYNYPYSTFYLKLIASPEPFVVEMMELSPLPAPGGNLRRGESGGDEMMDKVAVKKIPWFTRTLCFRGSNPHYNSEKR